MSTHQDYILRVSGLSKSFSGVKALDNVQLNLRKGEVHALMGENGAGKSTFMNVLIGLLTPDAGEIIFNGEPLKTGNVSAIQKKGIFMIHQEIMAVPELSVAQNLFLGREGNTRLFSWLNDERLNQQAADLLERMGLSIQPTTPMKYLSVAQMQMVEIAKAVANEARVIIMDEPTSALSDKEVDTLFRIINDLTAKGVSIIYISHKMDEIFTISDTITVLRDGKYIATRAASELDIDTLITLMVGRTLETLFPKHTPQTGDEVLSVSGLSQTGKFENIRFTVHAGEVLGIAGLMGAGRTEIARAIYGLDRLKQGEVVIKGRKTTIQSPADALRSGIGYVSEDRKLLGFIPQLSVEQNLTLASLKGFFIRSEKETETAISMMADLKIKANDPQHEVMYLSGGNQQKVVIGKVLLAKPAVVILDEPTRGIDIGAKAEIYKLINQLTADGVAIILISSELPEILGLSDRILVLSKGRQTAMLSRAEATQEAIMRYAMEAL